MEEIIRKIRGLIGERLKLAAAVANIGDDAPLFGPEGLGLDSIDVLELVLALQKEFGVVIEDRATAVKVMASIRTIAEHVASRGKV